MNPVGVLVLVLVAKEQPNNDGRADYAARGGVSSSCRVPRPLPSTSRSVRVASGSLPSSSRSFVAPSQRFVPSAPAPKESFRHARATAKPASRLCRTHEAAGVLPCSSRMNMWHPPGNLRNSVARAYSDDVPQCNQGDMASSPGPSAVRRARE